MNKEIIKELDNFISEINNFGLPYSYEILKRNKKGIFDYDGLSVYDTLNNVENLILLKSKEHPETENKVKFLVVEVYKEYINNYQFGSPSFTYIYDSIGNSNLAHYQLDSESVGIFKTISDAVSFSISSFEIQNFQKDMTLDIFEKLNIDSSKEDQLKELVLAELLFQRYNSFDKKLFDTKLDTQNLKLIVNCEKYNNWVEISNINEFSISGQVSAFLSENLPVYIKEATDLSSLYAKNNLKNNKKLKI